MSFKELNWEKNSLKSKFSKFYVFLLVTFILYSIVFSFFLVNIRQKDSLTVSNERTFTEALLLPQADVNPQEIFTVDPLMNGQKTNSILEIRKSLNSLIFSTLFKENTDGGLTNELVKEMSFTGAKRLELKLNQGIYWHDGKKLTSDDVIFTLNQIRALGQNSVYYGAVNGGLIDYKNPDENTVVIDLIDDKGNARPNAAYPFELTFPILPKHLLQNYPQAQMAVLPQTEFGKKPIGSGRFQYGVNSGMELKLNRNDRYFGKNVNLKNYTFKLYKNQSEIQRDFELKNIQLFTSRFKVPEIKDSIPSQKVILKNLEYVMYFNLNYKNTAISPFIQSFTLRNTLTKVLNRDTIIKEVGGGRPVFGPIDQSSWAFNEDVQKSQTQNLDEWKAKVSGLGFSYNGTFFEKDGKRLQLTLSYLSNQVTNKIVEAIKSELKTVGVDLNLDPINDEELAASNFSTPGSEIQKFTSVVNNRNFEALLSTVTHKQDPDLYAQWHSSNIDPPGSNIAGFNEKVGDSLLVQGRVEENQEKRKDKYVRFQKLFIQETPAIYLINPFIVNYYSPKVKGLNVQMINDIEYKYENMNYWELVR